MDWNDCPRWTGICSLFDDRFQRIATMPGTPSVWKLSGNNLLVLLVALLQVKGPVHAGAGSKQTESRSLVVTRPQLRSLREPASRRALRRMDSARCAR